MTEANITLRIPRDTPAGEEEIRVCVHVTAGTPACRRGPQEDRHPAEEPEVTILWAKDADGRPVDLTATERAYCVEEVLTIAAETETCSPEDVT